MRHPRFKDSHRVRAQAAVEPVSRALGIWKVEVWGRPADQIVGDDRKRHYQIHAASDNIAAHEGIRRFVAEMTLLHKTAATPSGQIET